MALHPLALSLLSPGFLVAGLVLASLPIIIHILNRRRFRTINWAAMDFLLRAMRKNRKRLRFEQWLLLAMRCLVLAMLGLALARPLSCSDSSLAGVGQKSGLHVFVIDDSCSMAYQADRPDAKTHFDQTKRLVEHMIDQLGSGESVAVVTTARPVTAVLAKPTFDLQQARAVVDRLTQRFTAADLPGALRLASDIGRAESRQPNRNLYLLTDSARSAWQTPETETLKVQGPELAKIFRITHFNLSLGRQWNQAVLDVQPSANLVTAKNNFGADFIASVKGFGEPREAALQWKLDGNVLGGGGATVHLDTNTPPQTQSNTSIKTGGPHVITASLIGDDRLKVDNARNRVVNVASELKVLIVEGQRGAGPLGGSGAFLQLALAPPREAAGGAAQTDSYVAPELISDLELGNRALQDYRAVILCGVGQIQPAQADQLAAFVQSGGTLLLFMGEPVASDNYNTVLLPRKLMPGPLTKRMSAGDEQHGFTFDFNPNGSLHPLLKAFANEEKSGLDTAQVFTYWQADVPLDPQLRVLNYRSPDGAARPTTAGKPDPAITVHSLGQGKVVFVSTTANADWTTLPAKPAYVALMHELLAGSVNAGDAWMNLAVGQSLVVPANVKLTLTPTLLDPQSQSIALQQSTAGDGSITYHSPLLELPGIYTLTTGTGNVPIAVNLPPDTADVTTVDDAAIRSALGNIDMTLTGDQPVNRAESAMAGNDLGWNVMTMVLVMVALESFLAMRFGHFRR